MNTATDTIRGSNYQLQRVRQTNIIKQPVKRTDGKQGWQPIPKQMATVTQTLTEYSFNLYICQKKKKKKKKKDFGTFNKMYHNESTI